MAPKPSVLELLRCIVAWPLGLVATVFWGSLSKICIQRVKALAISKDIFST